MQMLSLKFHLKNLIQPTVQVPPPGIIPVTITITPTKANGSGIPMEVDKNGVETALAYEFPNPPHDVISVNSSTTESSLGDDGGGDAGVGTGVLVPKSVIDSG